MRRPALVAFGVLLAAAGSAAAGCGSETSLETEPPREAAPGDAAVASPIDGGGGASEAGPGRSLPAAVNALVLPGAATTDAPLPLYRLAAARGTTTAIAFRQAGTSLEALDQDGRSLWKKDIGEGALFGGFDVDGDGVVDLGLVRSKPTTTMCYGKPLAERSIDLVLGGDGTMLPNAVAPLTDICWNFGYATEQWSVLAALFGSGTKDLVLIPQYTATNENALTPYTEGKAFVVRYEGGGLVTKGSITMPTVPAYDAFPAAMPEPHGSGTKYYAASHVPNGLVVGADARLLFFTSGRAVEYATTAPYALLADRPYLTAGRTDLVGRNYGLVMPDPKREASVALVTGAGAISLWTDATTATMTSDPYGGIERHVSILDAKANTVDDRFFSYAHDGSDAYLYEQRTTYPNGVWLGEEGAAASRLVFDVYQGGHWHAVITAAGSTATDVDVRDLFVWDVRDVDGDGALDVVASPVRDATDPDVAGYYFPKWRTVLFRWDAATKTLVPKKTIEGALPWLVASFRDASRSSSGGFLYPALTAATESGVALVLRKQTGERLLAPLP